jgi:hypothetical protein
MKLTEQDILESFAFYFGATLKAETYKDGAVLLAKDLLKKAEMQDFKTMKEITEKVFKTPEDEEFERIQIEMEQRDGQGWRKRQIENAKTAEEAFSAWDRVSHQPNQHELQKQAFNAGWDAAMKKRWSEQND